jgi:hypothetical protein
MKATDAFISLKLETMQLIIALQDPAKLEKIRAILNESEPTPQAILDRIDRAREESKADLGTPLEEYLEEIKDL